MKLYTSAIFSRGHRMATAVLSSPTAFIVVAYCLAMLLLALPGLLGLRDIDSSATVVSPQKDTTAFLVFFSLFLALVVPAIETLLMGGLFRLIGVLTKSCYLSIFLSATIWMLLHEKHFVFFIFLIYSYSYIHWRKQSWRLAFVTTYSIHALYNATVFGLAMLIAQVL